MVITWDEQREEMKRCSSDNANLQSWKTSKSRDLLDRTRIPMLAYYFKIAESMAGFKTQWFKPPPVTWACYPISECQLKSQPEIQLHVKAVDTRPMLESLSPGAWSAILTIF